jgi:TonB family protein
MQQGLVQVELSFWQRVYLLWTFRNFRRLSISLFNPRERALLNALYASGERVAPDSPDPSLVIGVVDDFVPLTDSTSASPTQKQELEREVEVPSPRTEGAPQPQFVAPSLLRVTWSRLAAAAGVLCLFAIAVVGWHRIQNRSVSQARHQPLPRDKVTNRRDSPHSRTPSALAQNPPASSPLKTTARQHAALKSAVHPASIIARIPAARPRPHVQSADTIPNMQLSGQDRGIQASRAPVHIVYPAYPEIPILGVVALTARVDSGGRVLSVRVVSGKPALARAAINAVRQWRYSPYLKDGEPVATEVNILISFFSDDAISLDFTPERFPPPAQNLPASMPVKATARQYAGPKSAVHRASITARIPVAKQPLRVQSADTIPNIQFSGQDCGIQSSRAPVHFVYPAYPEIPILGVVALTARVDSGGAVLSVRVVSGKPALARAAINAVRQWRYPPYLKDGEPVATEANILISFFSDDAISLHFTPEHFPPLAQNHLPACQ